MGFSTNTLNKLHIGAVRVLMAAGLIGLGLTVYTIRTMQDVSRPTEEVRMENKEDVLKDN